MSRLIVNIVHDTNGQLQFGVQSDNADQQVALLQHQLANAQTKIDGIEQLEAQDQNLQTECERLNHEIADLNQTIREKDGEIARANQRANEAVVKLAEDRADRRKKKAPPRRRR